MLAMKKMLRTKNIETVVKERQHHCISGENGLQQLGLEIRRICTDLSDVYYNWR